MPSEGYASARIELQHHDDRTRSGVIAVSGHSLRGLAAFVDVDLDEPFGAGRDTPQLGDPDVPIEMPDEATEVLEWLALGASPRGFERWADLASSREWQRMLTVETQPAPPD